jgi:methylated-DNA-[protein]-cysteine S-methyltransferase
MSLFEEKVLFLTKKIPRGRVTTYGEIARILKTGPRAVGGALHKNPHPIKIPCHRVVKSNGSLGGYSGGIKKKIILLKKEGIKIENSRVVNFNRYLMKFKK